MQHLRKRTAILAVLMISALLLAACPPGEPEVVEREVIREVEVPVEVERVVEVEVTPTPAPRGPKTLIICQAQEPDTLWIYGTSMLAAAAVQWAIHDGSTTNGGFVTGLEFDYQASPGLVKLPTLEDGDAVVETVQVEPGTVIVKPDGSVGEAEEAAELPQMTVTFQLTEGMAFSDGAPVTAQDSVFSYEVANHPESGVPSRFLLDRTESYVALDDYTIQWTGIPGFTTATYFTHTWIPLPRHILEDIPPGDMLETEYARQPIGHGPFVLDDWISGDRIVLKKNENYWREGLPKVDEVIFRFIPDTNQLVAQLIAGECDIGTQDGMSLDQAPFLDEAAATGLLNVYYVPGTVWEHIDFNIEPLSDRPHFWQDARVRQAVAYGTNRQEMVDVVLFGRTEVLDAFVPSVHWAFPPEGALRSYPYDPEQAVALLEEAGWVLGDDGVRVAQGVEGVADGTRLEVAFNTTSGNRMREQTSQIFQANMAEIGLRVNLDLIPAGVWFGPADETRSLTARQWDIGMFAWLTGVMPSVGLYRCDNIPGPDNAFSGQNSTGYCNPEYDSAATAATSEIDREASIPLYHEVFQIFAEELPVMPLFARVKVGATRPEISGYVLDPTENSEMFNIAEFDLED